jgi:hypothetical protein
MAGWRTVLRPGVVQAHVVLGPGGVELLAAGDEFTDQPGQVGVAGSPSGLRAQQGHRGVQGLLPVGEGVPARGVQELQAGDVDRLRAVIGEQGCVQPAPQAVDGEDVEAADADEGRRVRYAFRSIGRPSTPDWCWIPGAGCGAPAPASSEDWRGHLPVQRGTRSPLSPWLLSAAGKSWFCRDSLGWLNDAAPEEERG